MLIIAPPFFIMYLANTCVASSAPRKFRSKTNRTPAGSRSKRIVGSSHPDPSRQIPRDAGRTARMIAACTIYEQIAWSKRRTYMRRPPLAGSLFLKHSRIRRSPHRPPHRFLPHIFERLLCLNRAAPHASRLRQVPLAKAEHRTPPAPVITAVFFMKDTPFPQPPKDRLYKRRQVRGQKGHSRGAPVLPKSFCHDRGERTRQSRFV